MRHVWGFIFGCTGIELKGLSSQRMYNSPLCDMCLCVDIGSGALVLSVLSSFKVDRGNKAQPVGVYSVPVSLMDEKHVQKKGHF